MEGREGGKPTGGPAVLKATGYTDPGECLILGIQSKTNKTNPVMCIFFI